MKRRTIEEQKEFAKKIFIEQIAGKEEITKICFKHDISVSYFSKLKKKYHKLYKECQNERELLSAYEEEFNNQAESEPEKAEQIVKSVSTQPLIKVLVHPNGDKSKGFEVGVFEPELDGEAYKAEFDRRVKNKIQWTVVLKSNDFI